ncbi:hypothetical protein D3C72_1108010 [compost metagenome]
MPLVTKREMAAVAVPVCAWALISAPSAALTCTAGSTCGSDTRPTPVSTSTMPAPPASSTATPLSVRAVVPRRQLTTLPATLAGSSRATPPLSPAR